MSQPEKNLRVRRTQKLLRDALVELTEEHGFDALTVGEITERAMVSRAAFYRAYRDKYDLVEQIFEEATSALRASVGELGEDHPAEVWVTFFEHIAAYERLHRALLGGRGSLWFARKMRAAFATLIAERGRLPHGPDSARSSAHSLSDSLVPELMSALFVEAIAWWLEHGRPSTPREMAARTALLASALFREASTWR
jgi:AcrR family transcriptional regulator